MSEDTRKIIDVLEVLLFDSHPMAHKVLPYLVFNKAHLNKSQLSEIQIRSVLKKLVFKNYLKESSIEDFENDSTGEQQKIAEDYFQQVLDAGATPESIVEAGIEKMKTAGIRVSDTDFMNDDSVFKHRDINKEIKDSFEEDIFKAKILSVHRVLGDLFKLTEDLKNGREWKDIKTNYQDLTYNPRTTELFLLDENPIKISKYSLTKNQHSKVLKAIFKYGKDKPHKFSDFMKNGVLPKRITSSDYYKICQEINKKKVAKATKERVTDFLLFSMDSVQINPDYSKKLHQLTLQIT